MGAGSATGEEAYSIAIVLAEVLGERLAQFDVRVFATDLDPNTIQTARAGIYPRSALENLGADLRERYFLPHGRALRVGRAIRERCVFANHDLVRQPPNLMKWTPPPAWRDTEGVAAKGLRTNEGGVP